MTTTEWPDLLASNPPKDMAMRVMDIEDIELFLTNIVREIQNITQVLPKNQCKHPAKQQDRAEVRSRILRWGGKSFVVGHDVVREDGILLAQGHETRVWGRHESGPGSPLKGQSINEDLKALFRFR